AKKAKHKLHEPAQTIDLKEQFLTQPPREPSSSPWRIRGAIWQKKQPPSPVPIPEVHRSHATALASGMNQGKVQSFGPSAPSLGNAAEFDIAKELADLPSDAFSSSASSSSPKAQGNTILISSQDKPSSVKQRLAAPVNGLRQTTLFDRKGVPAPASQTNKRHNWPLASKEEPPTHHKLDTEAMKTWVYPTNLGTIRDYQYNIVARGLFHNLLVALPTGLGKTFIAATIMLNWLRWTKDAQIIFVAPTKPLVSQQVEACFGIAGISRSQTTMLTGGVPPALREEEWQSKRVFFMTPQTLINDLKKGICDPKRIVLLVVDEAHRATGAYAYVEVVQFIRRFNSSFRVLALTATPGSDVESVQKVIDGLDISRVEIRTESSLDIAQFVHSRKIEKKSFTNSRDMLVCMDLLSRAVQPVLNKLNEQNAFWARDPMQITNFGLQKSRQQWMASEAGRRAPGAVKGMVMALFMSLTGLAHGIDMLKYHGIRPFYTKLLDYEKEAKAKYQKQITGSDHFHKLMDMLRDYTRDPDYMGHPKLEYLRQVILNHFMEAEEGRAADGPASNTRIMVFASWRDSAEDIARVLKLNEPMIRPHVFVGQAASKNSEGMDQKRQLEVVEQFKAGKYNTLIATSIGEEGLDIGEVDLIVCYDSKASPIRMLQRMGRTGRKRQGNIVLLQMAGKEEDDAFKAKDNYERMQEMIAKGDRFNFHDDRSRRIVPKEIQPQVDKRVVEIPVENSQRELPEPRRGRGKKLKGPQKKFHMPDGVRTGFVTASRMDDSNYDDDQATRRPRKQAAKKPSIIDEPEPVVTLDEVTLDEHQEKQLARLYQQVNDADDDGVIEKPSTTSHPERQRRPTRTRYFAKHGRATASFIDLVNRMHNTDTARINQLKQNLHKSDLEDGASADEVSEADDVAKEEKEEDAHPYRTPSRPRARNLASRSANEVEVGEGLPSSPPATDPRWRIRSQALTLGSADTEGEDEEEDYRLDSELADFIADDAEPIAEASSSPLPEPDADLPDLGTILGRKKTTAPAAAAVIQSSDTMAEDESEDDEPVVVQQQKGKKRRRRVIEDSDDEDEE
ncbi:P-loop containing nucleoside triphosphate hydrolase protein, partial [Saccharata proteae CBS 121410]